MKFRADLCYYKQHYDEADVWYRKLLQQLLKTHSSENMYMYVVCTVHEDCWVQSCHCLFGKSIALLCPAHTCFELNFVFISMAMICECNSIDRTVVLLIHEFFFITQLYVTYDTLYRIEPLLYYVTKLYVCDQIATCIACSLKDSHLCRFYG